MVQPRLNQVECRFVLIIDHWIRYELGDLVANFRRQGSNYGDQRGRQPKNFMSTTTDSSSIAERESGDSISDRLRNF